MASAGRSFAKYEGLGNDFLVIDAITDDAVSPEEAARLCDRHFGVGGDGVLLVLPPRDPAHTARMKVLNADGSVPEMCGNGLRCVALHVALSGRLADGPMNLETDAGLRPATLSREGAKASVRVDMGVVRFLGMRKVATSIGDVEVALGDAGNPHAILFGDYAPADVRRLGPELATHAAFPDGTNVEFCRVTDEAIEVVVWERGVGLTLACGTGACAVAVVACATGRWKSPAAVPVRLPGGTLLVEPGVGQASTWMTGPARRVFEGRLGS
jgi:diaminopimelate epimerase